MRPILLARLDKVRPVLVLTRESVRGARTKITVAPITSRVRGLDSEVAVGTRNGLEVASVVSCDNVETVAASKLGRVVGYFYADQEPALARALTAAFDLSVEELD